MTAMRDPRMSSAHGSAPTVLIAVDSTAALLGVLETKLMPPSHGPDLIARRAPVQRLVMSRAHPLVAIVAPPGYGKTIVAQLWAAEDERPFAWYSADERDSDPATLVRGLTASVDRTMGLGRAVIDAVTHPGESIWARAMPRLGAAVARMPPF